MFFNQKLEYVDVFSIKNLDADAMFWILVIIFLYWNNSNQPSIKDDLPLSINTVTMLSIVDTLCLGVFSCAILCYSWCCKLQWVVFVHTICICIWIWVVFVHTTGDTRRRCWSDAVRVSVTSSDCCIVALLHFVLCTLYHQHCKSLPHQIVALLPTTTNSLSANSTWHNAQQGLI